MKIIKQNFESPKNGLIVERERERERGCSYLTRKNQATDLSGFKFNIQHACLPARQGKSAVVFTADFLFSKFILARNY